MAFRLALARVSGRRHNWAIFIFMQKENATDRSRGRLATKWPTFRLRGCDAAPAVWQPLLRRQVGDVGFAVCILSGVESLHCFQYSLGVVAFNHCHPVIAGAIDFIPSCGLLLFHGGGRFQQFDFLFLLFAAEFAQPFWQAAG
jgi:hypothetical protein